MVFSTDVAGTSKMSSSLGIIEPSTLFKKKKKKEFICVCYILLRDIHYPYILNPV